MAGDRYLRKYCCVVHCDLCGALKTTACWLLTRQRFRAPSCPFRPAVGFFLLLNCRIKEVLGTRCSKICNAMGVSCDFVLLIVSNAASTAWNNDIRVDQFWTLEWQRVGELYKPPSYVVGRDDKRTIRENLFSLQTILTRILQRFCVNF
jgi:hypothetical protein